MICVNEKLLFQLINEHRQNKQIKSITPYDHICLDMIPEDKRTLDLCMRAVSDYVYNLKYVPDRFKTVDLLKKAFSGIKARDTFVNGRYGLFYVADQFKTPEICELAVIQDAFNFRYVPDDWKTPDMCRRAVLADAFMIRDVPPALVTYDLCKLVVKGMKTSALFNDIPDQFKTEELCFIALENKSGSAGFFQKLPTHLKTRDVCVRAVIRSSDALRFLPPDDAELINYLQTFSASIHDDTLYYIPKQSHTAKLCTIAVNRFPTALKHVAANRKTKQLCLNALERDISVFREIPWKFLTYDICVKTIRRDSYLYPFIPYNWQTEELYEIAKENGYVLRFEDLNRYEICLKAVEKNGLILQRVPSEFKTFDLCWKAVCSVVYAIQYVPTELINNPLTELVIEKGQLSCLKHLPEQFKTKERCMKAIDLVAKPNIRSDIVYFRDIERQIHDIPHHVRNIEFHLFIMTKIPFYFRYMPHWIQFLIKSRLIQSRFVQRNNEIKSKPIKRLPVYQVFGNKELQDYVLSYL